MVYTWKVPEFYDQLHDLVYVNTYYHETVMMTLNFGNPGYRKRNWRAFHFYPTEQFKPGIGAIARCWRVQKCSLH